MTPNSGMPFANLMGVEVTDPSKEKVIGRLVVRADLCTSGHILHGGAIMAFADALGAVGGFLNLPAGARTTTIESKTNFVGSAKEGTTVTGESIALHIGRSSSVWQTRITGEDGKLVAIVIQTQMTVPLAEKAAGS
ncbi:PaaI family thioesterase [Phenylobacterium sp.]|uniref:PaaI family thioesterase n=1 Tax=Phenylobacterium sp. TaxID=1871053 RepID=UPI00272622F2|nr:PaaI family thioesterase [Phenylobacterium sp.]MDO8378406.1 PaaI family thioesterase [Phenylobacterium sp.]